MTAHLVVRLILLHEYLIELIYYKEEKRKKREKGDHFARSVSIFRFCTTLQFLNFALDGEIGVLVTNY